MTYKPGQAGPGPHGKFLTNVLVGERLQEEVLRPEISGVLRVSTQTSDRWPSSSLLGRGGLWLCSWLRSTSFSLQLEISMSGMMSESAWFLSDIFRLIVLFPDQRLGLSQSDDLRAWAVWPGYLIFLWKSYKEWKIHSTGKSSIKAGQWSWSVLQVLKFSEPENISLENVEE